MFLIDVSSPIGSGTKCHLCLLKQIPSEVVYVYNLVPVLAGAFTVASVWQSGIHTDLPCLRASSIVATINNNGKTYILRLNA